MDIKLPAEYYESRSSLLAQHLNELHTLKRHILNQAYVQDDDGRYLTDANRLVDIAIGLIKVQESELSRQYELDRIGSASAMATQSRLSVMRGKNGQPHPGTS